MSQMKAILDEAKLSLASRRRRHDRFPEGFFRDPAWDMLVDLFVNTLEGRDVSVSSLAIASGVPSTTALRYVTLLEKQGYLGRFPDLADNRVTYLRLSGKCFDALKHHFKEQVSRCAQRPSNFVRPNMDLVAGPV